MQAIRSTRPGGHVGYLGVAHGVQLATTTGSSMPCQAVQVVWKRNGPGVRTDRAATLLKRPTRELCVNTGAGHCLPIGGGQSRS